MRDRVERSARQWQRERESAEQYNGIKYVCKCWSETLYCGFALRTYSASSFNIIITITIRYTSYTFDFSLIVLFRFVFLCVRLTASFWRLCPTNQLVSMSKLFSLSLSLAYIDVVNGCFFRARACRSSNCVRVGSRIVSAFVSFSIGTALSDGSPFFPLHWKLLSNQSWRLIWISAHMCVHASCVNCVWGQHRLVAHIALRRRCDCLCENTKRALSHRWRRNRIHLNYYICTWRTLCRT